MVGIGPGGAEHRTRKAEAVIADSDLIVGYTPYVESIADLIGDREIFTSGMRTEITRCRLALERAVEGAAVSLISSGDAGIYGMAGLAMEIAAAEDLDVTIEVIPGVTAANAAAAVLGAPLMLDFAVVSLSDLLVDWETIRARLKALAGADMVTALYNPRSKKRVKQLDEAIAIFREHHPGNTPVGVVTAAGCDDQHAVITDLDHVLEQTIGMRSLVIIANSAGKLLNGLLVTSRGYQL